MARRVFLHIGAPKTGTTFLQTVMWHNKVTLARHGVLYPGERRMDHYHASRVVRGVPPQRMGAEADTWDRLVRALEDWPDTGLISHEFLCMATPEQARAAVQRLAPAEVHVVLTARDYLRQFPAMWQESLKNNSELSLDRFMDRALAFDLAGAWGWESQDIATVLERWATAVPVDRVHVITVPRPGGPRDLLWRRWCHVLDLDPDAYDLDVAFTNESLGAAQATLLRRVRPHLSKLLERGNERHRWFRQYFAHEVLLRQPGQRFGLRDHHAEALRTLAEDAVKSVESAGYDVTGDLAELVPDLAPDHRPHPDDVPDSELIEVAGQAIEQMVRDVRRLTLERNEWKRRAKESESGASVVRRADSSPLVRRARGVAGRARTRVRRVARRLT